MERMTLKISALFTLVLGAALAMFYLPWLIGSKSFYLFDISAYYEPTLRIMAESFRQGKLLLWNPYSYCGMPQIAITEPGLFYLPNWLFACLPFNSAFALNLLIHQLIAGLGMILLIVSFGWGLVPAMMAGIGGALCAYMFSCQTNFTLMATAAWCPLLFWLIFRIGKGSLASDAVCFFFSGIVTAMMILAGRPEIFAPALLLIGFYTVGSLLLGLQSADKKIFVLRTFIFRIAPLFLGVLISMPAILPVIEWLPLSPRDKDTVPEDILYWSSGWYDFLCLLLPQPLGDLYLRPAKFAILVSANPGVGTYFASAFVGPVIFALALLGIGDRAWVGRWPLLLVLLVSSVLAAGYNTPLAESLIYQIPGVSVLRYPVKLLYFPVIALIIFSARGLYLALENRISSLQWRLNLAGWLLFAIAGSVLMYLPYPILRKSLNPHIFMRDVINPSLILEAQHLIGFACIPMAAVAIFTLLLCWLKSKNKMSKLAFSVSVLSLLYGSLILHAFAFAHHSADPDYFKQPSLLQMRFSKEDLAPLENVEGGRIAALFFGGLLQPNEHLSPTPIERAIRRHQYTRQVFDTSQHCDQHYGSSFGYMLSETADYRKLFVEVFNQSALSSKVVPLYGQTVKSDLPLFRFCQMTSTIYQLVPIDKLVYGKFRRGKCLDPALFDLQMEDPGWNIRIFRTKNPLPRAYLSSNWQIFKSHEDALAAISNSVESRFDPWNSTIIECSKNEAMPEKGLIGKVNVSSASILENTPNKVLVEADAKGPALLVLTDHYYPGWLACVDQKPAEILRANGLLRGVFVPAGKHQVEFRYEPKSLTLALTMAMIALIILLAMTLLTFVLGKRSLHGL